MKFQFKVIKEAESKLKFSESSPKIQGKKKNIDSIPNNDL